jgi:hypothetical protein
MQTESLLLIFPVVRGILECIPLFLPNILVIPIVFAPLKKDSSLLSGLREAVDQFRNGNVDPRLLNRFIRLCHSLAESHLSSRRISAVLSRVHALNVSDLAFDCIGDLFRRDDTGRFPQLETYFESCLATEISDHQLLVYVRRLIASKVNQGMFRLLNEADPSLGKILRNIKLAIASLHNFDEVEWFGEPYLIPSLCETLEHLPALEQEELERNLMSMTTGNENVPVLLSKLAVYLRTQSDYRRRVSLVTTALVFRSMLTLRAELPAEATPPQDPGASLDAATAIRLTMNEMRQETARYVQKGKVTADDLEAYCQVIEEGLTRRILHGNGQDFTLFRGLQAIYPALTKEQYRKLHRSRLEYLARRANQLVATKLRDG